MNIDKFQKIQPSVLSEATNDQNLRSYKTHASSSALVPYSGQPFDDVENAYFGGGIGNGFQQPHQAVANMQNAQHQHFSTSRHVVRYTPYNKRTYANAILHPQPAQQSSRFGQQSMLSKNDFSGRNAQSENTSGNCEDIYPANGVGSCGISTKSAVNGGSGSRRSSADGGNSANSYVTLQISNLDTSIDERILKQHLINRLKSITTVLSIYFEAVSVAKIKLPSLHHARQAIAHLHRKKIGHKRITVAQTRDSSSMEPSTLRCQVAGLLKDIPNYKLSMYKFRELFQSRFKTSISVTDLYDMKDICTIVEEKNEDKFITLRPELINSIENSELMDCLQHSVPYCSLHFVKSHRGWAEQEIDPLPNVQMTVSQVRLIMYELLKRHQGDIPIASVVHCIHAELQVQLVRDDQGVNFEHLISCVPGILIGPNKFGIKILNWANQDAVKEKNSDENAMSRFSKFGSIPDLFSQVSREILELIKLSPKATLKFSRFIPAYHNHFGKQCRVADYGYTKLIDLFEALSSVVQVMGDGENRQITLTHKSQVRRFTSDLLRILRAQTTKSILMSQLTQCFENILGKKFDITDYGVCDIQDILTGLANNNIIVVNAIPQMMDIMISIPKRKQSAMEVEKTSVFAGEVVELFKRAAQFVIPFEKFACSYHYQFGYQCRLCDYGFSKLVDLMEAISGLVEMELSNEEDRKIFLSPKVAQRIFSEQLKTITETFAPDDMTINLHEILVYHKKEFGYQITSQSLGFNDMFDCIRELPFIEVITHNGLLFIKCHHDDQHFRQKCYAGCRILLEANQHALPVADFVKTFASKYNEPLNDRIIESMNHAIEIVYINDTKCVTITKMMKFILHMINVIEPIGTIKMADLKTSLNIPINGCFSFGYPNLTSLIQAFSDVFVSATSKPINHRGDIKLNKQCILTNEGYANYSYTPNMNATSASSGYESLSNINDKNTSASSNGHSSLLCPDDSQRSMCGENLSMNNGNTSTEYSQFREMMPTQQFFPASNSSFNISDKGNLELSNLSGSFGQKSNEFLYDYSDSDAILGNQGMVNGHESSQFSGLNSNVFNVSDIRSGGNRSLIGFGEIDTSTNRLFDMYYQAPKPDTPPHVPYWLDPVWTREPFSSKSMLNINLPDLKLSQSVPKLDTPTVMASLSKSRTMAADNKENVFFN